VSQYRIINTSILDKVFEYYQNCFILPMRYLRPIRCTPALSVTQQRRCSCGMGLVVL